ncbi:MAG TPA: hypothetical protein GX406_03595 [Pseudoclavibacter sp.]|nr:hypothetical protein [Pseudoclavibacter sp.]
MPRTPMVRSHTETLTQTAATVARAPATTTVPLLPTALDEVERAAGNLLSALAAEAQVVHAIAQDVSDVLASLAQQLTDWDAR